MIAKQGYAASAGTNSVVFLTDNQKFIEDWNHLPTGASPHVTTFKQVRVGQHLTLGLVAFVPPHMQGDKQFQFGIKLLAPDGSIVIDEQNYSTASGKVSNQGGYLLADPALSLDFNAQDIKGIYHFYIQMTDVAASTQSYSDYAFTLQ